MGPHLTLSAELEAALVRQLASSWDEINASHFRSRMRRPQLGLHEAEGRLGQWHGDRQTLTLARSLVLARSWGMVREVLKHEMAHQFVDQVLGVRDESAHGPVFQNLCRDLGIDATAAGLPAADPAVPVDNPVLRRITRLLALAESPNRHEAELAMRQAQRLMLKHNLDRVVVAAGEGYTFRQVGTARRRVDAHEHILASILGDRFFVEVIWVPSYLPIEGRAGRVLELCGTLSNLDVATYVHGFLLETSERLWREHKRSNGIVGDRERRRFLLGVMMGFSEKLDSAASESRQEGLIWTGDSELTSFLRRRYPRRSGGGAIGFRRTATFEHGRAAGRTVIIHRPVHSQGDRGGRLLPRHAIRRRCRPPAPAR